MSGTSDHDIELIQGTEAFASAAAELAQQCETRIDILSVALQPELWATAAFVDEIKRIVIARSRSQVRILINEATIAAKTGNRLIELSRQLSSAMTIRGLSPMHKDIQAEWLLGDHGIALIRDPASRLDARRYEHDRVAVKKRRESFDHYWDNSIAVADLRRLHI